MMARLAYRSASGGSICGKMILAVCAFIAASPSLAEVVSCQMADGDALEFAIDHNQFVDAVDPKEPPRRKVTFVQYGTTAFAAEPIVMGAVRGFHAADPTGSTLMFIVQQDGRAILTNRAQGLHLDGMCRVKN